MADVVVGATTFEYAGEFVPGRVYLYFGGANFDDVPDLVLDGQANGDRFGYAHAAAGDFNGDGHLDLLVGAYQNDANGSNSGRAYVYFGGPGLDSTPDLVLTGLQTGEQFGIAVAGVGDVNADGYDDVLIGARFNTTGGPEAGRAYVYYGGPTVDDVPDLVLNSQSAAEQFGFAVAGGGDLNGDGHADVLVGAYHNHLLGFETGRVYVYFGGPAVDSAVDLVLDGEGYRAHFGDALGTADANGDGHLDILVGASQYNVAAGRAYVYFGGPTLDRTADLVLEAGGLGDWYGRFVSGGGDYNLDGFADLLIGAPALNSGGPGRAYLYHGGPLLDSTFDLALDGQVPGDAFGWNGGARATDVDADGLDDFVVGGFRNDTAGYDVGRAYVFLSNNHPPDCSQAAATLTRLWPPNRELVPVGIVGVSDPDGDAASVRITSITSDEPTRGRKNDRCPDAFNDGQSARLRAERAESGNGRVYTLQFEASDPQGASCTGRVTVCVPAASLQECVDDGPVADATACPSIATGPGLEVRTSPSGLELSFDLETASRVELGVFDVRGRLVRQLADGPFPPGHQNLAWDGRDSAGTPAPAGIYVLRLTTAHSTRVVKAALVR